MGMAGSGPGAHPPAAAALSPSTGALTPWRLRRLWTLQLDAVGAMNNAIQNCIADRRVSNEFMPAAHRNLAGHQQRSLLVAVLDDLEQVAPLLGVERLRPPIVEDQQIGRARSSPASARHSRPSPRASGECGEQPRCALVQDREIFPAGLVRPARRPAMTCRSPHGPPITQVLVLRRIQSQPASLQEQGTVQTARCTEVDVLHRRGLTQLGRD